MKIYETYDKLPDSFLLGVRDVMAVFRTSRSGVYRLVDRGVLNPVKIGGSLKFKVGEVRALANGTATKLAETD